MATERNVVDFKIHNLTEEQFQELKAQGKIDPNALYCTPDTTLKTNQITNCPIEIPQDIKLELSTDSSGVSNLIIKAGSKLYYPNGSGVFDKVVLTADKTYTDTTKTGQWFVCLTRSLTGTVGSVANSVSGTSQPTAGFSLWYNTEENIMYRYGSITSDPTSNVSLPIAVVTLDNTGVASIDQVFNGFGYIGSTVFALPGVKGVVPSGRNEDGTLKNGIVTLNKVSTYTRTGTFDKWGVYISTGGKLYTIINSFVYNEHENIIRNATDNTPFGVFQCGTATSVDNKISFEPKTTFHAVDYNDFENTVEELNSSISAVDSSVVHKTGDETISGIKNFTAPSLRISNVAGTGGTGINILDSNGKGQTYLHHFYTGGRYYSRLVNHNATAAKTSYVEVVVNDDGKSEFTSYNVDTMRAPTPASTSNSTDIATTAWANAKFLPSPAGLVAPFAGKTAPSGWLKCDGSAVSRTTYAALFAVIGTLYGAGDGSTTFNLPNLVGRVPLGMSGDYVGKTSEGVLPNITGFFGSTVFCSAYNTSNPSMFGNGAFSLQDRASLYNEYGHIAQDQGSNKPAYGYEFNASRSSSLYGGGWFDGSKVIPASVGMNYCIKY